MRLLLLSLFFTLLSFGLTFPLGIPEWTRYGRLRNELIGQEWPIDVNGLEENYRLGKYQMEYIQFIGTAVYFSAQSTSNPNRHIKIEMLPYGATRAETQIRVNYYYNKGTYVDCNLDGWPFKWVAFRQ